MSVTDEMVIAAGQALDAHPWAQGKPMVPSWVIRAVLEAAVRQRSRDDADLEKRVRDMIFGIGLTGKERAKDIIATVRSAAPPPTAAPGEYDRLCEKMMELVGWTDVESVETGLMREAAAAIRKLTAEADRHFHAANHWCEMMNRATTRANAAEARAAALEEAQKAAER